MTSAPQFVPKAQGHLRPRFCKTDWTGCAGSTRGSSVPGSGTTYPSFDSPSILAAVADTPVTIPDKPAFKAGEVCELAQIQPYVLRSWESEFPDLGISKTPGGPRVYRRSDVERVLRIRDLVFTEGLTLSGVRRRFEAENPPQDDLFTMVAAMETAAAAAPPAAPVPVVLEAPVPVTPPPRPRAESVPVAATALPAPVEPAEPVAAPVDDETRAKLGRLKQEMRSLLDLLGGDAAASSPAAVAPAPGIGIGRPKRKS